MGEELSWKLSISSTPHLCKKIFKVVDVFLQGGPACERFSAPSFEEFSCGEDLAEVVIIEGSDLHADLGDFPDEPFTLQFGQGFANRRARNPELAR